MSMSYFSLLKSRIVKSLSFSIFWADLIIVIFLGSLGVWFPFIFGWSVNDDFFNPEPWFTFGVGTLTIITAQRMFMKDIEDIYSSANKIIVFCIWIFGCIMYGKSYQYYKMGSIPEDASFLQINLTEISILITLISWFFNHINNDRYNSQTSVNALGGDL